MCYWKKSGGAQSGGVQHNANTLGVSVHELECGFNPAVSSLVQHRPFCPLVRPLSPRVLCVKPCRTRSPPALRCTRTLGAAGAHPPQNVTQGMAVVLCLSA